MGDENPIRTLGDYSKPSHEGYRNTTKLSVGNNVVPLRSDTIRLVQNGCSFHGLRTAKLCNDILMFQQHHGESLSEAWTRFKDLLQKVPHHGIDRWLQIQKFYDHVSFHLKCEIDRAAGGKLRNKYDDESWEIIENLALYDHEGWDDTKEFIKPVKAITAPQGITKTPDRRLLELEDQINFLLKGSRPAPPSSSIHNPQAYVNAAYSSSHLNDQNESPTLNSFAFRERTGPAPQPQALGTTFEARVRDYMAAHTERMERFENTIFKQREEINGRMTEIFRLLKELTTSRTLEKVLIREEAKFSVTKNVNSISLARNEEEENNKMDETPDNTKIPIEIEMPVRKAEAMNGAENGAENKSIKTHENDKAVEAPGFNNSLSGTRVGKKKGKAYKVLPRGPVYDAILKKKITKKEDVGGNFKIPCSIGDLKHVNALVDQGSDDVLVEVVEHVFPVDFVILDIKENEKRPFILGTPFLTTAKATIKFDTGTITLRSGKSKVSFYRISDDEISNFVGRVKRIKVFIGSFTYECDFMILEDISSIIDHHLGEMAFEKPFIDETGLVYNEEKGTVMFKQ
ncbi:zinc finger, CCHC-type containing protein, partial [Tanacetum coccineum]